MIKTKLVGQTLNEENKEINWDKQQILESKDNFGLTIVITTGEHSEYNFAAVPIFSTDKSNMEHGLSNNWAKRVFRLPISPITITFVND